MSDDLQLGGGAPPLVPGPSLEDEEKAMRGGKGGLYAILGGIVLLIVGGILAFVLSEKDVEAYETLGRNVNGIKGELFEGFWHCAFQGNEDVGNNTELVREINERASTGGQRYGAYLQRECMPKVGQLEERLRALIPPDDMVQPTNDLIDAAQAMQGAAADFVGYLGRIEGGYDESDARSQVSALARGWFDYKNAHNAVNAAIAEKIGE